MMRKCSKKKLAKFESCVKKVKKSNRKRHTGYNPWAICHKTIIKGKCKVPRRIRR